MGSFKSWWERVKKWQSARLLQKSQKLRRARTQVDPMNLSRVRVALPERCLLGAREAPKPLQVKSQSPLDSPPWMKGLKLSLSRFLRQGSPSLQQLLRNGTSVTVKRWELAKLSLPWRQTRYLQKSMPNPPAYSIFSLQRGWKSPLGL